MPPPPEPGRDAPALQNEATAAVLDEVADLLALDDANPFRVRAYRNAARLVRALSDDVTAFVAGGGDLTMLPGVGADVAGKILEIAATGRSALLEDLRGRTPPVLVRLLRIPGLGPKRVSTLYRELAVTSEADLEDAARRGRIRGLFGFGVKTEQRILTAVTAHRAGARGSRATMS